ncbi:MAG: shikimate kinase [Bacteroidota bacterium]|nr:shikimate kinase [Bacteroidota bacterium]
MIIYLVGFMGSGKSTYGKMMAEETGYSFIDLDQEIEGQYKMTIPELFEKEGQDNFRIIESQVLKGLILNENQIVACGGGTPCYLDNMSHILDQGTVVYLKYFEKELVARLENDDTERPMLQEDETLENVVYKLLRKRAVHYHRADLVINPELVPPAELLALLVANSSQ